MKTKIIPLGNRVLLKAIDAPKEEKSVLILVESTQQPQYGKIVAVGKGVRSDAGEWIAPELKKGQKVLLPSYGFEEIMDGKEKYFIGDVGVIVAAYEE